MHPGGGARGYCSISWKHFPAVFHYVENQGKHHRKVSVVNELKRSLETNGIAYDPKYLL
jgi:hypothetical protein